MPGHVPTWWQVALLPEKWNVAGFVCPSLTLWQQYALQQTFNPYMTGAPADRDAAAGLLLFCSRDYNAGKMLFVNDKARHKALKRINRALRRRPWREIHEACAEYVTTCLRVPGHKEKIPTAKGGPTPRKVAAPEAWILFDFLTAGNSTPAAMAAAWNTPFAVARCRFDARRDVRNEADSLETLAEEIRFTDYIERRKAAGT